MTLSALYYPHITIADDDIIRTALLLWDRLFYIAPAPGFFPFSFGGDQLHRHALELMAEAIVPSAEIKKQVHETLLQLATAELPDWFFLTEDESQVRYELYPRKLLPETWEALQQTRLAAQANGQYLTSGAFGLALMAVLAEACAGNERTLVTDEIPAYAMLQRYLVKAADGHLNRPSQDDQYALVTISLKIADLSNLSIKKLISMRESEGAWTRSLRHHYVKQIEEHAEKLGEAKSQVDREEIQRAFEQAVHDDLAGLGEDLKDEAFNAVFSKELAVSVLALAGAVVEPWSAKLVGVGSLSKLKSNYAAARRRVLSKHPMAWLYTQQRRML